MKEKLYSYKYLIMLFAIILIFSSMSITFAYWGGTIEGTADSAESGVEVGDWDWEYCTPIYTAQEFYDFATSSTSLSTDSYCLKNDIDFTSFTWEYLDAHVSNSYQGTFNGKGYTLSNISIETSVVGQTYLSLFSRMNGGTIQNVNIENYGMGFTRAYFDTSLIQAGIFAGEVSGANNLIENITITNSEVLGNSIPGAGGLVGQVEADSDLVVRNIKATNFTVLNKRKRAGGLISRVQSGTGTTTVEDIDFQGIVACGSTTASNTGGIFGTFRNSTGSISRAVVDYVAEGSVSIADDTITYKSTKYVGGFIGNNNASTIMTINDSFYTGELYNILNNVGSVLGRKKASITLNEVYYSNVLFVDDYVASTSNNVINGTVVNATSMPSNTWWNGFFTAYSAANSLWTQDASGRPILIR